MGKIRKELTCDINTTNNVSFKQKNFIPFLEERDKLGKLRKKATAIESQDSIIGSNQQLPSIELNNTNSLTARATYKNTTFHSLTPPKSKKLIAFNSSQDINPIRTKISKPKQLMPSIGSYYIPSFVDKYKNAQANKKKVEEEFIKYRQQKELLNQNTLDLVNLEKAYDLVKKRNSGIAPFGKTTSRTSKKIHHKLRLFGNLNYQDNDNFEQDFTKLSSVNHKANYIKKKQTQFHRLPLEEITIDIKAQLKQIKGKEKQTMQSIEKQQNKLKSLKGNLDIQREKKIEKNLQLQTAQFICFINLLSCQSFNFQIILQFIELPILQPNYKG